MLSMVSTTEFNESIKLDKSRFAQLVRVRFVQRESLCLVMIRQSECHTQQDEETKKSEFGNITKKHISHICQHPIDCFDGQWRFGIEVLDDFESKTLMLSGD